MEIYVLNKSLERIGVVDDYASIIWAKRYFSAGDFELYLPASAEMLELLREDYYLQRDDDDRAMIIEDIQIQTDAELGNFLIVSGRSLESILSRRIVWQQTTLTGTAENAIRRIITENCINPAQEERVINRLRLAAANGFTETLEQQLTGENVAEWLETVCKSYGYGWKIVIEGGEFVFYLYRGTDHTYDNAENNPFVVFSPDFDNLVNSNFQYSKRNYKNAALIHGEGEGAARTSSTVGIAVDLDRYELYVDARDISSNDGEISAEEYTNLLTERGVQSLTEYTQTTSYDGEVDTNGVYVYGVDFNIGDLVQIENEYGFTATSRIIEIIENEDSNGYKVVPTFSEWSNENAAGIYALKDADGYILTDSTGAIIYVGG